MKEMTTLQMGLEDFEIVDKKARKFINDISCNVKLYGAKGDGIIDDTSSIQEAINEQEVVFFPNGTYLISRELLLKSNTKLMGEKNTILKMEGQTSSNHIFRIVSKENITIENINFESTLNSPDASAFNRNSNLLWSNIIAIHGSGAEDILIKNCYFNNFEYAIKFDGGIAPNKNITVENIKIENTVMPFFLSYLNGFIFRNSKIYGNETGTRYDHVIYASSNCSNFLIENCLFDKSTSAEVNSLLSFSNPNENDGNAQNIIIKNCEFNEVYCAIHTSKEGSDVTAINITGKTTKTITSSSGFFRSVTDGENPSKLTIINCRIECPNMWLLEGDGEIHLLGGYVKSKSITEKVKHLLLKNVIGEIVGSKIVYIPTSINNGNININGCHFITPSATNSLIDYRADCNLKIINNTFECKGLDSKQVVYGSVDLGTKLVCSNNTLYGFTKLLHDSINKINENNTFVSTLIMPESTE